MFNLLYKYNPGIDILKFRNYNVHFHISSNLFSTLEAVHVYLDSTPILSNQFKLPYQNWETC